tara:strand:+ start:109 stop:249 length:141 start_codon:yes stop_codon:yes gene_type:complete
MIKIPFTDYYIYWAYPEFKSPAPPQKPIPKEWTTGITPEDAFKMCE